MLLEIVIPEIALPEVDIENHVWITARGQRIPVCQMSTSHIHNCVRCWNGQGRTYINPGYLGGKDKWLKIFNEELIKRQ